MKPRQIRSIPVGIAFSLIAIACLVTIVSSTTEKADLAKRFEWMTYDWRMRLATNFPSDVSSNLAAVFIDDYTIEALSKGELSGIQADFPFPRHIYGRVLRELAAQEAKVVAMDIMLSELKENDPPVFLQNGEEMGSDQFFARQLKETGNVVIAQGSNTPPAELFRDSAMAVGHIVSISDADGVLRRARPFVEDEDGKRRWHMGLILAAQQLGVNLDEADVTGKEMVLISEGRRIRSIPLDDDGMFSINWRLDWNDARLLKLPLAAVFQLDNARQIWGAETWSEVKKGFVDAGMVELEPDFPMKDKLAVIGSTAEGNNVSDIGMTPLSENSYLVSKHWNVANMVITGDFIQRLPLVWELALLIVLAVAGSWISWRSKMSLTVVYILLIAVAFVCLGVLLFIYAGIWLPLVMPIGGGLFLPYLALVSYRVIFEEKERRRIKGVFSKIVSPNVVNELLDADHLSLGGARRPITVFFADVRGFTQMTDSQQELAERMVRERGLEGEEAERFFNQRSAEVLATVNLYLAAIADVIKKHEGTLDKYIGDCVMAFWGAPTPNEKHAVYCVRAAIDAQRAIYRLNMERSQENKIRKAANEASDTESEKREMLPLLTLGTGINTGFVTVGLMGSDDHILNYTVFGREVNLASRLEGLSGRGRIIIGESTYRELMRFDPQLAATCVEQTPATVKGIRESLTTYEVPWKETPPGETAVERAKTASSEGSQ